jgi:hypothetical protein
MPQKLNKEMPMKEFADRLAYDCIYNCCSDIVSFNGYLPTEEDIPNTVSNGGDDDISTVTQSTTYTSIAAEHVFRDNPELELQTNGKTRPIRRHCRAIGCRKTTQKMCHHPRCLCFQYPSPKGLMRSVFYCPEHYYIHFDAIAAETGV